MEFFPKVTDHIISQLAAIVETSRKRKTSKTYVTAKGLIRIHRKLYAAYLCRSTYPKEGYVNSSTIQITNKQRNKSPKRQSLTRSQKAPTAVARLFSFHYTDLGYFVHPSLLAFSAKTIGPSISVFDNLRK